MLKYSVKKEFYIDCAHRLLDDDGDCKNVHGHSYQIIISLCKYHFSDMILHFGDFKKFVNKILSKFDHAFLINKNDPLCDYFKNNKIRIGINKYQDFKLYKFNNDPTVECMALEIFTLLTNEMTRYGSKWDFEDILLDSVEIFEGYGKSAKITRK